MDRNEIGHSSSEAWFQGSYFDVMIPLTGNPSLFDGRLDDVEPADFALSLEGNEKLTSSCFTFDNVASESTTESRQRKRKQKLTCKPNLQPTSGSKKQLLYQMDEKSCKDDASKKKIIKAKKSKGFRESKKNENLDLRKAFKIVYEMLLETGTVSEEQIRQKLSSNNVPMPI